MDEIDVRFKGTEEELEMALDRLDTAMVGLVVDWEIVQR